MLTVSLFLVPFHCVKLLYFLDYTLYKLTVMVMYMYIYIAWIQFEGGSIGLAIVRDNAELENDPKGMQWYTN